MTTDGKAITSASVAISSGPTHTDIAAITDEKGYFLLTDCSAGRYQITAHKTGYRPQSVWVDTRDDQVVIVTLNDD